MSILHSTTAIVNRLLAPFDVEIVRKSHVECFRNACLLLDERRDEALLPNGAAEYLRWDNSRLTELRARYKDVLPPSLASSRWTEDYTARTIDLKFFRSHNAYVFSDSNWEFKFALTAYYARLIDDLHLFTVLSEDGLFGCPMLALDATLCVSRDLLDSIFELHFLERVLRISSRPELRILDIGAGYGRLAHSYAKAMPSSGVYLCTDVVPESTFLSEYYLRYRGVDSSARVVPFDVLERTLGETPIDLAINIHSFSECTLQAISWWVDLLRRHGVRYLMVVPNAQDHGGTKLMTQESGGGSLDFLPLLESCGYELVEKQPKYSAPIVQKYGLSPTYHYLFELQR